jgi:hypothetical protein
MNITVFIISLLSVIALSDHPFYVSVTDIHYKKEEKSLQVSQKLFWDDFEVALGGNYQQKVDFIKGIPQDRLEIMAAEYLLSHNKITVNGKLVKLEFVGYEIEEDAVWFYMQVKNIPTPNRVIIYNTILTDYFDDQKNITNFYLDEKPKSIITNKKKTSGELRFD